MFAVKLELSQSQSNKVFIPLPRSYPARALRALGLLLAHSGTGRDFLARNGMSQTKTAVTQRIKDIDKNSCFENEGRC